MFFKDIKPDSLIHVFNRKDITISKARVISVSQPHLDPDAQRSNGYSSGIQMYVDVVIEIDGNRSAPYVCPENSEIVYANNLVLTPDITPILREVEATKNASEQILSPENLNLQKQKLEKCNTLLAEFSPSFRKEKEIDERFSKIEGSVGRMEEMMKQFFQEWNSNGKK